MLIIHLQKPECLASSPLHLHVSHLGNSRSGHDGRDVPLWHGSLDGQLRQGRHLCSIGASLCAHDVPAETNECFHGMDLN